MIPPRSRALARAGAVRRGLPRSARDHVGGAARRSRSRTSCCATSAPGARKRPGAGPRRAADGRHPRRPSKLSGDSFFADELDLLETLASELAIGLKNAQLYHEIVSIKEYNERLLRLIDWGVIAAREDGVITTLNPAAERILGIEAGRVLGRSLDVLDPAIRAVLRSSLVDQVRVRDRGDRQPPRGASPAPGRPHLGPSRPQGRGQRGDRRLERRLAAQGARGGQAARRPPVGPRRSRPASRTRSGTRSSRSRPSRSSCPSGRTINEFRSTFAKVAVKEIHRIEQLLGRLRALAAPTPSPPRPLDLQVPLAETLDLLRGEAHRRRVRLVVEIEHDLPPVLGEPTS